MIHDQFMYSSYMRKRYWGRSLMGWEEFATTRPNAGHRALSKLEEEGFIGAEFKCAEIEEEHTSHICIQPGRKRLSVITQNVDGLHSKAGTTFVTELHGHANRLKCMHCGAYHDRFEFQRELKRRNLEWILEQERALERQQEQQQGGRAAQLRPDGDAHVATEDYSRIDVLPCPSCCRGVLKPDVVFFGDAVPKPRVQTCYAAVEACDGLLCIGSSLTVHSAYRFVTAAAQRGIPIAILNVGTTRAESNNLDVTKIEAPAGPTLSSVADLLCSSSFAQDASDSENMAL